MFDFLQSPNIYIDALNSAPTAQDKERINPKEGDTLEQNPNSGAKTLRVPHNLNTKSRIDSVKGVLTRYQEGNNLGAEIYHIGYKSKPK